MARMGIHEILCMADFSRSHTRTPSRRFAGNLLQVLQDKSYRLLLRGLEMTGLSDRLAASGPYTVLAPTDDAFKQPHTSRLLENPSRLREVLSRHIVWGHLDLETIFEMDRLAPINGGAIEVDGRFGLLGERKVVQPNLLAPNGIVHGIAGMLGA